MKRQQWIITGIIVPILVGVGGIGFFIEKIHEATLFDRTKETIEQSLDEYYSYLNKSNRDIDLAYQKLSSSFKDRKPLIDYIGDFDRLRSIKRNRKRFEVLLGKEKDKAAVYVVLDITSVEYKYERWEGFIELVLEDDEWVFQTMKGLIQTK